MEAVVFSVHVPSLDRMSVLQDWLDHLLQHSFGDCDLFIGINASNVTHQVQQILDTQYRGKFKRLEYAVTPEALVVDSDVSGYQTALRLLTNHLKTLPIGTRYNLVWFGHTKGSGRVASPEVQLIKDSFWC